MSIFSDIPNADEIMDSGICDDGDSPGDFFHCTPFENVESILKNGLQGGHGKNFDTEAHSTGKVFLAIGEGEAFQWKDLLAMQLFLKSEDIAMFRVKLTSQEKKKLKTDDLAYMDGNICSVYCDFPIPPKRLTLMNSQSIKESPLSLGSTLRFLLKEDAASEFDIFGKYLFGQERGIPQRKPEPNTDEEDSFGSSLAQFYQGDVSALNPWTGTLAALEKSGKYEDFLTVPSKYKYAYRTMSDISDENLRKMLGGKKPKKVTPGALQHASSAKFISGHEGRKLFSWTTDPSIFSEMLKDWGTLSGYKPKQNTVFLRAPIGAKGNHFIMNPEHTGPWADQWHYQSEIFSIGDVECDAIWFIDMSAYVKAKKERDEIKHDFSSKTDQRVIRQVVGHNRELAKKKVRR